MADLAFCGLAYLMMLLHIDPGDEELSVFVTSCRRLKLNRVLFVILSLEF